MAGQVIYHLLAAAHATKAPWPVVVVVSCMPVVTLGFGAALTHLLRSEAVSDDGKSMTPGAIDLPPALPAPDASADAADPVTVRAALNGHAVKAERLFAADVTAGRIPGIRRIQTQLHVGQPKARLVQEHLRNVLASTQ